MKLISLYIENFGGLHQYELTFDDGLTVIREENGFGKSTLAEFIRAMFYGFPRKGKTLDKSRRQKYTPWNGGGFGGNLVFEAEGNRYRVERTFGATPKGDSFTLIDLSTNRKSNRYSEELGLELFQLDGDSFERSTYLPQLAEGQSLTTDSIRSKLSNLVEDTNDVGNFEKAITALKTKRSALIPYRGNGGSVAQATSQVTRLQDQLQRSVIQNDMLKTVEDSIEEGKHRIEELENLCETVRGEIRRASEFAAVAAVHRQHQRLMNQLDRTAEARQKLEETYPAGIPAMEEIEGAQKTAAQLAILRGQVVTEQEDLEAEAFLETNRSRFEGHIPTEGELAECRSRCEQLSDIREKTLELAASLSRQPEVKVKNLPLMISLILAVAGAAVGIWMLLMREYFIGAAALVIGVAAAVTAVVAGLRLSAARKQLQQFHQEQQQIREEMNRLSREADDLTAGIEVFLGIYGNTDGADYFGLLAELEHDSEDYLRAKTRVAQWQQEKCAHGMQMSQCEAALAAFFEKASLTQTADVRTQLMQIRDDRKQWEEWCRDEKRDAEELDAFQHENAQALGQTLENAPDMAALQQKEAVLTRQRNDSADELLRLQQRREQLIEQAQMIPQIQDELRFWQEKKLADQKNADLLDDTMALLEHAKENLSGSYLGPIRNNFAKYLNRLWKEQEGGVLVTPDLDVQLERYGQARELGYFSAGQTDMVMLGMRFALVDALFTEEKPFVILDDPFINLDDDRTQEALALLKTLAEDRQIIYLTCNSSRAPQ